MKNSEKKKVKKWEISEKKVTKSHKLVKIGNKLILKSEKQWQISEKQ